MKLIDFPGHNVIFAENQPEYLPLPAHARRDETGEIICCWQLTFRERVKLLWTGKIWHSVYTFNGPLQPQLLATEKPPMPCAAKGRWARVKLAPAMFADAWEVTDGTPLLERLWLCWTAFWVMLK